MFWLSKHQKGQCITAKTMLEFPEEYKLHSEHGESLKTTMLQSVLLIL